MQNTYAPEAREIVRACLTATLATLEPETQDPAASLVAVATDISGAPLLLISDLAQHTRNITADNRCAILFDGTEKYDSPLEGGRVSLKGHMVKIDDKDKEARYLRHHKDAETYVDFKDFHFYGLNVESGYFVGGFGNIYTISAKDILLAHDLGREIAQAEADIIEHMNEDHTKAIADYAAKAGRTDRAETWEMVGIDPEGIALRSKGALLRINFPEIVKTPQEARQALVEMAQLARE